MSQSTDSLLVVEGVRAGYGAIMALEGVSLTVRKGELVTVIGANGAGKTTLLRTIAGTLPLKGGQITFAGRPLNQTPAEQRVACGISLVPEGRRIFPRLTVKENLLLGAYRRSDSEEVTKDLDRLRDLFPVLRERAQQMGGLLSGGEQQMLAICRALMSRPRLLLMDEPSMGVAPLIVERIFRTIELLHQEGLSILLIEQNALAALSLASRGYVLEGGRVVLSGDCPNLKRDPRVHDAYLGGAIPENVQS